MNTFLTRYESRLVAYLRAALQCIAPQPAPRDTRSDGARWADACAIAFAPADADIADALRTVALAIAQQHNQEGSSSR